MNPFMLEPRADEHPPKGYVSVHVPGMRRVWIDRDLAVQIHGLLSINKLDEARTLLRWFGGSEETP